MQVNQPTRFFNDPDPDSPISKNKYRLVGEPWKPDGRERPRLIPMDKDNNVWLKIWLGHPDANTKEERRPIEVKMSPMVWRLFCNRFRRVLAGTGEMEFSIRNFDRDYNIPDRVVRKSTHGSELVVGRTKNNLMFIGVRFAGRPSPRFMFKPDMWHEFYENGEQLVDAASSNEIACAWLDEVQDSMRLTLALRHKNEDDLKVQRDLRAKEREERRALEAANNFGGVAAPATAGDATKDIDVPF